MPQVHTCPPPLPRYLNHQTLLPLPTRLGRKTATRRAPTVARTARRRLMQEPARQVSTPKVVHRPQYVQNEPESTADALSPQYITHWVDALPNQHKTCYDRHFSDSTKVTATRQHTYMAHLTPTTVGKSGMALALPYNYTTPSSAA